MSLILKEHDIINSLSDRWEIKYDTSSKNLYIYTPINQYSTMFTKFVGFLIYDYVLNKLSDDEFDIFIDVNDFEEEAFRIKTRISLEVFDMVKEKKNLQNIRDNNFTYTYLGYNIRYKFDVPFLKGRMDDGSITKESIKNGETSLVIE